MLNANQLAEFEKNGFVKGGIVLNDEEVERLREELDLVMEGKSVNKPAESKHARGKQRFPS
ncbi:hypothetical protein [Paenibacillus sp. AR247]|uniref:hypothetical protein n=1 Tax=Paenibacillus sp. AR247 TaxID=1631599 RepID=UPI000CF86518|nr:hypothetical protein [Paenibacillus sp. AR247]PQP88562.1 hypothetical protein CPT76_09510 [Paenibacillus sp. AR247]